MYAVTALYCIDRLIAHGLRVSALSQEVKKKTDMARQRRENVNDPHWST